jgi:hypothetical protein
MTIDEAFRAGLALVRKAGLPAKGSDIAVLAALRVFEKAAKGVQHDERFPEQGPLYARKLILIAYTK